MMPRNMPSETLPESMRLLVRHQWVREHGTPRVTALAGPPAAGRSLWLDWLRLCGRAEQAGALMMQPARAARGWLDGAAQQAIALAERSPARPVAVAAGAALLAGWLRGRADRLGALIAEGMVELGEGRVRAGAARRAQLPERARSLAELTLFEALEATPSTAGRFALNQTIAVHFGDRAAEIDLLSRADRVAVEIDGPHHFDDLDCYRRDRRKDALLQAHGYAVIRFLADDVLAEPRAAVRAVCELCAARARRS
jgi:very-short-patch-repair endonuclease